MSVTVNLVNGRRRVRDDPRLTPTNTSSNYMSRRHRPRSPSPSRLRFVVSNDLAERRSDEGESDRSPPPRNGPRDRSPPPRNGPRDRSPPSRKDPRDRSPSLRSDAKPKPSMILMSKKFQNESSSGVARHELASKKFKLDHDKFTAPRSKTSNSQKQGESEIPLQYSECSSRSDSAIPDENIAEPIATKPIKPSRSRLTSLQSCPDLFGNESQPPGVLLVQNLPLDVTGQELVMKVFPEHDILSANLYENDDLKPYAEIVFPRAEDAIGALKRHLGQVYRGHSLRITLLNSFKN